MATLLSVAVALGAAGLVRGAAAPARIARTLAALDELDRACLEAEKGGAQALYSRIPLVVERQVLEGLDETQKDREPILDHIYESCRRALAALRDGSEARRPMAPPPPDMARVSFKDGACWEGDRLVFPVVVGRHPPASRPFFAEGSLRASVPALAGATLETFEGSELARLCEADPTARRSGWDRPAGGLVADGALICLDHEGVRKVIATESAKAVAKLPGDGRPLYVSLGSDPFYTDYSELSRARFAAWLREHYRSARALSVAWGMEVVGFAPELLPTPDQASGSASRWCDFAAFNHERLTAHVRWAVGNVRAALPGVPVGLAPFRYAFAGSFALSGANPLALAEAVDVLELSGGGAMEADLAFALAGLKRAVVNPSFVPGSFGLMAHQLHGCAAVGLAAWPRQALTSLEAVREAEALMREALDARRLAPQCARLARAPRPIGILYSEASLRLAPQWALRCAESPYTRELAAAYQAARFLDLGVTFVPGRAFTQARWEGIRLLVVPAANAEEELVVKGILEFVELGGHAVIVAESFASDERGREADHLARMGIEVIHTSRPAYSARARPQLGGALDDLVVSDAPTAELVPAPDGPLARLGRSIRARGIQQRIKVNVIHTPLASFTDGSPAAVMFARGKGTITYLAIPLAPGDLAPVLRVVLAKAGIEPLVRLVVLEGGATGVECRAVSDGAAILAYAWNTVDGPRRVAFESVPLAAALDLATGRPVHLRTDGTGSLLGPMLLEAGDVALLQLTPARAQQP